MTSGGVTGIVESCVVRARSACKRLVLPEGHDERIMRAARHLKDDGIARPILLGRVEALHEAARRAGISLDGITTIDPEQSDRIDTYGKRYAAGRPNASAKVAQRPPRKPLFHAGM